MAQISRREYLPYTFHMCWYVGGNVERPFHPIPNPTTCDDSPTNKHPTTIYRRGKKQNRTQTKHDKLVNMQNASLWFVAEACNGSDATVASIQQQKMGIDACCVDPIAGLAAAR